MLASLLLLGCAAAQGREGPEPTAEPPAGAFLLLPLNVTVAMPQPLEVMRLAVWDEIEHQLERSRVRYATAPRNLARSEWLLAVERANRRVVSEQGRRADYDLVAGDLARELRKHAAFDAVIIPALLQRDATMEDRSAHWDGVQRRVPFETRGVDARRLREMPVEGVVPAASLHVAVFDADGEKLHEAFGGLEVLVRVRATGQNLKGEPPFQLLPRTDLLASLGPVREGVAIAFAPFLGRNED